MLKHEHEIGCTNKIEKGKGPHFDLGHWGKSTDFSFTGGTRESAHWGNVPTISTLKIP